MVKKFMAALLAATLFLCSVPVFAVFEDGESDIQVFSVGGFESFTDIYNFPSDSSLYCYGRSFCFLPIQGDVVTGGTGDLYPTVNMNGYAVPVTVDLQFTNNTQDYYDISSASFSLHMKESMSSVAVNLRVIDVSDWRVTGIIRPSGYGNLLQQITIVPGSGDMTVSPGQTITVHLYLEYFVNSTDISISASRFYDVFDVVSFAAQKVDAVDNNQGATAGGQQAIENAINDNHQDTVDQFVQATNPDQAQATTDVDNAASDLESFEDGIFTDINTYKADLDFSLDSWVEASAGLDYVRKIFMIIWNNSPSQIIVLSLMLGLAMYLLGRGPAFQRAEAAAARRERRRRGGD